MNYRQLIREKALDQFGYVTTGNAREVNVPPVELRKLAQRGALKNMGYGLYRLEEAPDGELDQFAEAVLRGGEGAHLMGDSILAIYRLGLVAPKKIRVGTPRRVRGKMPKFIEVIKSEIPPDELTTIEGIPSTTVAKALLDCQGSIMSERMTDAITSAWEQGLITRHEAKELRTKLRKRMSPAR